MKKCIYLLCFSVLFGGLAGANQITLSCVSIGAGELTFLISMDCFVHSPVVNLTTLALKKDPVPASSDSKSDGIVDTRTELAQAVAPVATISGMPVYLPEVASASASANKQNQNRNQSSTGNSTQTGAGSSAPISSASTTGGGGSDSQPVGNNSNTPLAAQAGGFSQSTPVSAMLGVTAPMPVDSPTTPILMVNGVPLSPPVGTASVPEPSVWLLTVLGFAGLLYRANRRRTA